MTVWSNSNDIIILTIAVYLGTVFTNFFRAFSRDIITPVIKRYVPETSIEKYTYGDLRLGDFFVELINVVVALVMVVLVAKGLRRYAGHVLQHLYR
jgi:large-conductance mechanosensitive channel